jgi:hypothetical protein
MSMAAWGTLEKVPARIPSVCHAQTCACCNPRVASTQDASQLYIKSYELGVLFTGSSLVPPGAQPAHMVQAFTVRAPAAKYKYKYKYAARAIFVRFSFTRMDGCRRARAGDSVRRRPLACSRAHMALRAIAAVRCCCNILLAGSAT